jgi:hypothetical protein
LESLAIYDLVKPSALIRLRAIFEIVFEVKIVSPGSTTKLFSKLTFLILVAGKLVLKLLNFIYVIYA